MLLIVHPFAFLMLSQAESRRLPKGEMTWARTVSCLRDRIPLRGTWAGTPGSRAVGMKVCTNLLMNSPGLFPWLLNCWRGLEDCSMV